MYFFFVGDIYQTKMNHWLSFTIWSTHHLNLSRSDVKYVDRDLEEGEDQDHYWINTCFAYHYFKLVPLPILFLEDHLKDRKSLLLPTERTALRASEQVRGNPFAILCLEKHLDPH